MPIAPVSIQYFLDLLSHGAPSAQSSSALHSLAATIWLWIVYLGYILSILGFIAIVYIIVRLFELRKREELYYSTVISPTDTVGTVNPRWEHIQSLIHDTNTSNWREAIIEADIMLDDALARRGYVGNGVGEKLKAVEPSDIRSLQDAWDVHKVRNQIAHEGSAFTLSDTLAQRTITRYETVLRELDAI